MFVLLEICVFLSFGIRVNSTFLLIVNPEWFCFTELKSPESAVKLKLEKSMCSAQYEIVFSILKKVLHAVFYVGTDLTKKRKDKEDKKN